jgi:hypothetical protein
MTDANNNSNNSSGGTVVITGSGGGGGGGGASNGNWISVSPGQIFTITIPTGANWPQMSLPDIDLAVPVEEKKKDSDGCTCKKCKEYYQYAEPNQQDGTLICYGCRMVW